MTVWRVDGEKTLAVKTAALSGADLESRGASGPVQRCRQPYRAMSAQRGIAPDGVYVAYYQFGSPASHYGLVPGRRIVEVDGQPTPNLDAFLRQVKRPTGPLIVTHQDLGLEWCARSHHAEARPTLLAGL